MRKNPKYLLAALAVFAALTLGGVTASANVAAMASANTPDPAKPDRGTDNKDFELGRSVRLLVGMMRGLYTDYVDEVDPDEIGKRAAAGMVSELDPYTELIHADDMPSFELMTTGRYGGIGSVIRQKGDHVRIAEPYKDSPADRAGLQIGDEILSIDGKNAKGMSVEEASAAMKGEAGTNLHLKVRKLYTGKTETLTIRREVIALPAIPYYDMLSDSIGYILHREFTDGCADDLRTAFTDLKSRGAKALILDYRSNGGGILQEAVEIVSMFVPKGTEVVSMRGRDKAFDKSFRTTSEPLDVDIPIVVLVDGISASAAEIVAGAMQDLDRGVVVGQRTFGKGLVQGTLPLGFDSYLKVTTAKYYTPSGRCIQAIDYSHPTENGGVGAVPDSLIREFRTAAGRKVYDGGGIMPDVRLAPEYSSRFVYTIFLKGSIDDFADEWSRDNQQREVTPGTFVLTDGDWVAFMEFMADKPTGYESLTARALEGVRLSAEAERLLTDDLREKIDAITAGLHDDDTANLTLHREELSRIIAGEIVLRRRYSRGVSEHNLKSDKTVAEAVMVLHDAPLYREILASRDTERK